MTDGTDARRVRIDAHLHTVASHDCQTPPEDILAAARRSDLDGVVVTDHDTVEGARIAESLAGPDDPVVIRGCEVSTAHGHLLGIGVDDAPAPGRPLARTAREIRRQGGIAVVPHPFQRSRHGVARDAVKAVDGIEVYNAHTLTNVRNAQAQRFSARHDFPEFGGSDAHTAASVGNAATEVAIDAGRSVTHGAVLDAMRAGRTEAVGRRVPALRYVGRMVNAATRKTLSFL
ncbi:CehA/McbA family metallohydrolase [Halosimplex aquaticum]|uniref:CehA/McbA family metallohydrolase n=1 Tax=Halosimplex aquaticum TaxID=3026162 RepID=A0ABD5Y0D7_9EURY|nr:PHP domain-containing protein [Halosimplex aquaticum]